jgi:hypothetical protein
MPIASETPAGMRWLQSVTLKQTRILRCSSPVRRPLPGYVLA